MIVELSSGDGGRDKGEWSNFSMIFSPTVCRVGIPTMWGEFQRRRTSFSHSFSGSTLGVPMGVTCEEKNLMEIVS